MAVKKCRFYIEYDYNEKGEVLSYEDIQKCKPYTFATRNAIVTNNNEDDKGNLEYYRFAYANAIPYNVSERIEKKDTEDIGAYVLVQRDKYNRIVVLEKIIQKRRFFIFNKYKKRLFRVEYTYNEDGELYSYKNFD
jgi:hypothetical protein